jgi:hypothetical protein
MLLCVTTKALSADFEPIGQFFYVIPVNGGVEVGAASDSELQAFLAQGAIEGFWRRNALGAIDGIVYVKTTSFASITSALSEVHRAQLASDLQAARVASTNAQQKMSELRHGRDLSAIYVLALNTGPNRGIADLVNSFFKYVDDLGRSVDAAQGVPGQIEAFIRENQAGVKLLTSAQTFNGSPYREGMQCSDLVIKASHDAGVEITTTPTSGRTMTETWFQGGMGPEYRQVWGGAGGGTLRQLANEVGEGTANLPIGSVIVTNGHAALYNGVVRVGSTWQLITYDSNDSQQWVVSLDGTPSPDDPDDRLLTFPGHQVGDHVTRLQWGLDHVVKVFQPIGNHPHIPTALPRCAPGSPCGPIRVPGVTPPANPFVNRRSLSG